MQIHEGSWQDLFFRKKGKSDPRFDGLTETARSIIQEAGLSKQRARVALSLDLSAGMEAQLRSGAVNKVCERLLALAVNFDDNAAIDVFVFGDKKECLGELTPDNFTGYIEREILDQYKIGGECSYTPIMDMIIRKYTAEKGDPAYVMFITGGACADKERVKKLLVNSSTYPIFWQLIGIGDIDFQFMKELDYMTGRVIDNANFFHVNDIGKIDDDQLFRRLLKEFPSWLQEARKMGIVK